MSGHRLILASLLKAKGLSHAKVAKLMAWDSPATVGNKLRGERDWKAGELEKMAEIAGTTLVHLAALSDDLVLAKHSETIQAAVLVDEMTPEQRSAALALLRSIAAANSDR